MLINDQIEIYGKFYPVKRQATPEEQAAIEREKREQDEREQRERLTPSDSDRIEAQALYTALMTDTLLEV